MNEKCLYENIIDSKTGLKIPVFASGRTVDSRYNPQRESQRICDQIKETTGFVIVFGIASGTLIKTILKNRETIFILAVENSQAEIDFLKQLETVSELEKNYRVSFCTIQSLYENIVRLYLPSFYGNLELIEQPGWTTENKELMNNISQIISSALQAVSADFSVQSHFGKLWQHNILSNLKFCKKENHWGVCPTSKTAVVFAAGPSLDYSIESLIKERHKYYFIATDTAFSVLLAKGIIPEAVVSLDGQYVSNTHFIHNKNFDFSETTFLFDLSANSSAVKKLAKEKANITFFKSGHPFCEYAQDALNLNLPSLFSGAGTVTISAVDFAIKAGFEQILIAGADFSYINGKPYAKGTYLDKLYNSSSSRKDTLNKKFCALQLRTELEQVDDNRFTTKVLQSYRQSFEEYITSNDASFEKQDELYKIIVGKPYKNEADGNSKAPDFLPESKINDFIKELVAQTPATFSSAAQLTKKQICLLPLISWIRTHDNNNKADFNYYFKKALDYFNKWLV